MFNLGMSEMVFIAILALILIGPKQLPEFARTLGRFLNEMKRASTGLMTEIKDGVKSDLDLEKTVNEIKKNISGKPETKIIHTGLESQQTQLIDEVLSKPAESSNAASSVVVNADPPEQMSFNIPDTGLPEDIKKILEDKLKQ